MADSLIQSTQEAIKRIEEVEKQSGMKAIMALNRINQRKYL